MAVAPTAHAVNLCSVLLEASKYQGVTRVEDSIHFGPSYINGEWVPFGLDARDWISELVRQSRIVAGPQFPFLSVNFTLSDEDNHMSMGRELTVGQQVIETRGSAIVLHEWAHGLFVERLLQKFRLFRFYDELAAAIENSGRARYSDVSMTRKTMIVMNRMFKLTIPYQELFSDLFAALTLKDSEAVSKILTTYSKGEFKRSNPNLKANSIMAARGFTRYLQTQEIEEVQFLLKDIDGKKKWLYPEHLSLAGARPVIWKEVMNETADHTEEDSQQILDLIYQVSEEEIIYRLKRPWLWSLKPSQIRERFVDRLRQKVRS